jgi:hypothetical protein
MLASCNEIFVVVAGYVCPSDIGIMHYTLGHLNEDPRPVTFVFTDISDLVQDCLREFFPQASIINTPALSN